MLASTHSPALSASRPQTRAFTTARPAQPRCRMAFVRAQAEQQQAASGNNCKTCGMDLSKAPSGCDGEGRELGGLAAVPGFGWWPIKAYKPCPGLSQAGMDYVRKGQATNEMLFGGVSLGQNQQESLTVMQETAEKGIKVDV